MSKSRSPRLEILYDRAAMLAAARGFFAVRGICEVDCPILSAAASVDAHIDLIPAQPFGGKRYLHSSPEYSMKRLLAEGMGDIFQISHVFRDGESGIKHNPEFLMAEWYRIGLNFRGMIEETLDFCRIFLGDLPSEVLTYRQAFQRYVGLDYLRATDHELKAALKQAGVEPSKEVLTEGREALLNQLLGSVVEPQLGQQGLLVLAYYPASQAALARTCFHGEEEVGERFEIYRQGVELANGYHELADSREQRQRFIEANNQRRQMSKEELPIDENFLQALECGLPDCCGVAVGMDRLLMLRHKVISVSEVLPFDWNNS